MIIVMVVKTSESGGSDGLGVESGGGVTDGVGVWDGPGGGVEEELVLEVVGSGGGGVVVVVVVGGGGGVVDELLVEDTVVTEVSPVFCRGLIAKPLSAASLASTKVASVTAMADSPMARISRNLRQSILKEDLGNESSGSMGDSPVEASGQRCALDAARNDGISLMVKKYHVDELDPQ